LKPEFVDNRDDNTLVAAGLYGLTEAHVRHVFETFHEGRDYQGRLESVLGHYRAWAERR
jgi:hypothetical protein